MLSNSTISLRTRYRHLSPPHDLHLSNPTFMVLISALFVNKVPVIDCTGSRVKHLLSVIPDFVTSGQAPFSSLVAAPRPTLRKNLGGAGKARRTLPAPPS